MRITSSLLIVSCLLSLAPGFARADEQITTRAEPPNFLVKKQGFWTERLVQNGSEQSTGLFYGNLLEITRGIPRAEKEASLARTTKLTAFGFGCVAAGLAITGLVDTINSAKNGGITARAGSLDAGFLASLLGSLVLDASAQSAAERAIGQYNYEMFRRANAPAAPVALALPQR
jgi:hypothetical protein